VFAVTTMFNCRIGSTC